MTTVASAGGRLRPGRGNILFLYSLPHGATTTCHVSLTLIGGCWSRDLLRLCHWLGSDDLLPDPGLAQPVSHVRGEAAVGQTILGLDMSQLTSWVKLLDTRASNESSRKFHNHAKRVLTSGFKNLCYPNWPSHMTFASGSQFYVYLPWVNVRL